MIIGVDGNEANVEKRVGVSVYTLNLLKYFKKQSNKDLKFKIYLKNSPLLDLPDQDNFFQYKVVPGKIFWSQIYLPFELYQKKGIDVFFSPAHYIPRFCPVPTVVTIHDLAYLYFEKDFLMKDFFQLKFWTKYSINKAKKIIAVSKATKKDLVKFYRINQSKINVVYNGGPRCHPERGAKRRVEGSPYILYVGTLQPRKNVSTLIEAFNKFKNFYPEFRLLIVGKKGWLFESIFKKVKELRLDKKVIFTGYISDQQLVWFYKNAFCLVLPSFYEGFGLPVLEAMSYNCPTVISISSSLKEIGGSASLYFDPKNSSDLLEKLILLKEHPELRKELIDKGNLQIKKFSWENCGKQTLNVIKSVCQV